MGEYTALHLDVTLKSYTDKDILKIIKNLIEPDLNSNNIIYPNHPFFKCERFSSIATMSSAYFNAETNASFKEIYDTKEKILEYHVHIVSNLKNYDQEIDKFLDFIFPYCDFEKRKILGYTQYNGSTAINYFFEKNNNLYEEYVQFHNLDWPDDVEEAAEKLWEKYQLGGTDIFSEDIVKDISTTLLKTTYIKEEIK